MLCALEPVVSLQQFYGTVAREHESVSRTSCSGPRNDTHMVLSLSCGPLALAWSSPSRSWGWHCVNVDAMHTYTWTAHVICVDRRMAGQLVIKKGGHEQQVALNGCCYCL